MLWFGKVKVTNEELYGENKPIKICDVNVYNIVISKLFYIKIKIKAYGEILYINFCRLNVPEDGLKHESVTGISFNFLLVYENKYYLQVHLENCAYKIVDK